MKYKVYHNPGEITFIKDTKKYLDQLDPMKTYIGSGGGKFVKYLKSKYDLTAEEYYNLIVNGDKDYRPKCMNSRCNNPAEFVGLYYGYRKCCCRHCNGYYVSDMLKAEGRLNMLTPEFRKITNKVIKDMHNQGTHPFSTVEVHARSRMTDFIRKSEKMNRSVAYLYLAYCIDNSVFKIGVTSDVDNYHGLMNLHNYVSMHKLTEGDLRYVAKLEYDIKIHFNQRTEYYEISRLEEVTNFIKSII